MVAAFHLQIQRERRRKQHRLTSRAGSGDPADLWGMLDYFAREVEAGRYIAPRMQSAVNSVLATAVAAGKLPKKKVGRPAEAYELDRQRRIAGKVRLLRAQGHTKGKAVEIVAQEEGRDERRVYEHCRLHKAWLDREDKRSRMLAEYLEIAGRVLRGVGAVPSSADLDLSRLAGLWEDLPPFRCA